MSRTGLIPVSFPSDVKINLQKSVINFEGKKGKLSWNIPHQINVVVNEDKIIVSRSDESKFSKSLHGLVRAMISNMVTGVSIGFSKEIILNGTGYRAQLTGNQLRLQVGFSHPVIYTPPEGVELKVEDQSRVRVNGIDRQKVGQAAANIRGISPAEPYKAKGLRYSDEKIFRKAGKSGKK